MAKAITFVNYSSQDFSHKWDGVDYDFPKGKSVMLESDLAFHFAKHLAVRELNRKNLNTGGGALDAEMKKALVMDSVIEAEDSTKLAQDVLNYKEMDKKDLVKVAEEKGMKVDNRKGAESIAKDLEAFEDK